MGMLGLLTNVALFVAGLTFLYVALYKYAFSDFHHSEPAMIIALLAMALSPAGRVLSIDSLIRNRGNPAVDPLSVESTFAGWPLKLVRWLFVFFYLSAVFSKMTHAGLDWANGYTLQWYLARAGSAEGHGFGHVAVALSHPRHARTDRRAALPVHLRPLRALPEAALDLHPGRPASAH